MDEEIPEEMECNISGKASREVWSLFLAENMKKILKYLKKIGWAPPGVDYTTQVN